MAVSKDIVLSILADVKRYQQGLAGLEGITKREAGKAALVLAKELGKAATAAARTAAATAKAAGGTSTFAAMATELGQALGLPVGQMSAAAGQATEFAGSLGIAGGAATIAAGAVAAVAVAVVAAGAGILAVSQKTSDWVSELKRSGLAMGMSTRESLSYSEALAKQGEDLDTVRPALDKMIALMDGVQEGNKAAKETFDKLGVSVLNADGSLRSSFAVLGEVNDALAGVANTTERAAIAREIFGKAGFSASTLGTAALAEAAVDTERLAGNIEEAGKRSAELKAASAELGHAWDEVWIPMGVAIMPVASGMKTVGVELIHLVEVWYNATKYVNLYYGAFKAAVGIHGLFAETERALAPAVDATTQSLALETAAIKLLKSNTDGMISKEDEHRRSLLDQADANTRLTQAEIARLEAQAELLDYKEPSEADRLRTLAWKLLGQLPALYQAGTKAVKEYDASITEKTKTEKEDADALGSAARYQQAFNDACEASVKSQEAEAEASKATADAVDEATAAVERKVEAIITAGDEEEKAAKAEKQRIKSVQQAWLEIAATIEEAWTTATAAVIDRLGAQLDASEQTEQSMRDRGKLSKEEAKQLNKQQKELREQMRAWFEVDRFGKMASIATATALAAIQAASAVAAIPVAGPALAAAAAIAMGALGAVQLGIVASEKNPYPAGGPVSRQVADTDHVNIRARPDEWVVNQRGRRVAGDQQLQRLNSAQPQAQGGMVGIWFRGRFMDVAVSEVVKAPGFARLAVQGAGYTPGGWR